MQRYSSITLHVSPKTLISEGSKKITSTKVQIYSIKKFLGDLVVKLLNLFVFESLALKIGSKRLFKNNLAFNLERAQTSKQCFMLKVLVTF